MIIGARVPATWQLPLTAVTVRMRREVRRFFAARCRFLMFACPQKGGIPERLYRRCIATPILTAISTRALCNYIRQ